MNGIALFTAFSGLCGAVGLTVHCAQKAKNNVPSFENIHSIPDGGLERAPLSLMPHVLGISGLISVSLLSIGVALFSKGAPLLSKDYLVNTALSTVGLVAAVSGLATFAIFLASPSTTFSRNGMQMIGGVNKTQLFWLGLAFASVACGGLVALRGERPFAVLRNSS